MNFNDLRYQSYSFMKSGSDVVIYAGICVVMESLYQRSGPPRSSEGTAVRWRERNSDIKGAHDELWNCFRGQAYFDIKKLGRAIRDTSHCPVGLFGRAMSKLALVLTFDS